MTDPVNSQDIIARALCKCAELDPDEISETGEPNSFHMRAYALSIENDLIDAGLYIGETPPEAST